MERGTNIPLTIVVAMAKTRVIGVDGDLPWRLSDDLKFFKQATSNKPVIMGRKTYESIGRPLPNRDNIVITRNNDFTANGVTVANSLEDAIAIAEAFAFAKECPEICIIGGGTIYEQALPHISTIFLTEVDADITGDTYFPVLDESAWDTEEISQINKDEKNDHNARVLKLTRKV